MNNDNTVLARNTSMAPQSSLYSQTVAFSHYNHLSPQLPIDSETGQLVPGGIKEQTKQCFEHIKSILASINHVMADIVKLTIFLQDIKDLALVDELVFVQFAGYLPSRTTVAVAGLPMGARIQVEALVSNGEGTIPEAPQAGDLIKLTNTTTKAPSSPYSSQTVAFSHYNHLSAQLPINPETGRIEETEIKAQTSQSLKNIKVILESMAVPLDDIVKLNIFLKNLSDSEAVDEVYTTFFPDSGIARTAGYLPARTIIAASLPMEALIQIEAIVSHGDGTPPQAIEGRHGLIIEGNNTQEAPRDLLATQSVAFSHYNHLSAQLPIDLKTGEIVTGGIREQTEQCLGHIRAIVESVDHVLADIVKVNIFLKDMVDLEALDEVYVATFPEGQPARRVIEVSDLPKNAKVQIDVVLGNAEGTPPLNN